MIVPILHFLRHASITSLNLHDLAQPKAKTKPYMDKFT